MDIDDLLQQPCPCGSGKTFGECCAPAQFNSPGETTRPIIEDLQRSLAGKTFASDEAMQWFLEARVADHNRWPLDDFDGLSPGQMQALLYRPFELLPLADVEERLPARPDAPVLGLFHLIAEAAGDKGIKLTARGNLPLKLVKAADAWLQEYGGARYVGIRSVTTEPDVIELHVTRIVADLAGLLRKAHGRLHLTRAAGKLVDRGDGARLYRRLLETYCRRFNWAYGDGYSELPVIRDGFGFTLYLLHRHGGTWRPAAFYEDAFLRAFPMVFEEVDDGGRYMDAEHHVRLAWSLRTLHGLGYLFGLVELAGKDGPLPILPDDGLQVRARPLLAEVFPQPPPA